MERNPILYCSKSKSYENFVKWSNEKPKTALEINSYLAKRHGKLLDIGAGDGTITKMIASNFDAVTIIEPGAANFKNLKDRLVGTKFQLINKKIEDYSADNKFDVILACHSLKFFKEPVKQLDRIKNMLEGGGMFLHIDHQCQNDFLKFSERYREKVLGPDSESPLSYDFKGMLKGVFHSIDERSFQSHLTIPCVEDAISILDFIYDVDYKDISKEIINEIRMDLHKEYGNGKIKINLQQTMHICS